MRIAVDDRRCQANGACVAAAPGLFALEPGGPARLLAEPDDADRTVLTRAIRRCPTQAIRVSP